MESADQQREGLFFFSYMDADSCCEELYVPQFAIAVLCHLIKRRL